MSESEALQATAEEPNATVETDAAVAASATLPEVQAATISEAALPEKERGAGAAEYQAAEIGKGAPAEDDHDDLNELLEDEDDDEVLSGGAVGSTDDGIEALRAGMEALGRSGGGPIDSDLLSGLGSPADVRASLGSVATGLAEQLSSITEEVNKIREELYGDGGIGGIAKQLEQWKDGGLNDLLGQGGLDVAALEVLGQKSLRGNGNPSASSRGGSATSSALGSSLSSSTGTSRGAPGRTGVGQSESRSGTSSSSEARQRRIPGDYDPELEEMRQRFRERSRSQKSQQVASVSIWEKLLLLFLVLVCLYIGSPFFRTSVKRAAAGVIWGTDMDSEEEEWEY